MQEHPGAPSVPAKGRPEPGPGPHAARSAKWGETQLSDESLEVPIGAPELPRIDVGSDYFFILFGSRTLTPLGGVNWKCESGCLELVSTLVNAIELILPSWSNTTVRAT